MQFQAFSAKNILDVLHFEVHISVLTCQFIYFLCFLIDLRPGQKNKFIQLNVIICSMTAGSNCRKKVDNANKALFFCLQLIPEEYIQVASCVCSKLIFASLLFKLNKTFLNVLGHSNRDHATSSKRGRLERFTKQLSNPGLDKLLHKALQAPSFGGGCVILITVPYAT